MSAVEDKIVAMKFDNKQFEPAAKTTMSTLDRLKAALSFKGGNKGLTDLQNTANRFSLKGLAAGAQETSGKFLAMAGVAIGAIANITSRAVDAGIRVAKAFTIEPLKQGFQEYETNLNAVQTILANTQASGAKLKDVNAALSTLNTYSDKTIYNFSEMARNIGTFTAAGVDLDTSVQSIKGIANLAALSGSNSQQASTAMYQLSQAISAGRVGLQDWNSVVNAGMGGTVFQRALAQTAERMGTLDKGAVKLTGKMKNATINGKSFRESITAKPGEQSWLTSEVLTKTLQQFTGDMTDAQLATMGFTKEQIKSIQAQAKTAQNAATQVKTFTQLVGTLQEAAGSGWSNTFQILFGDFEESKKLWTEVSNVIGGVVQNQAKARNKMLQDWKDLGGRTALIDGIRNIFAALVSIMKPIQQAFRDIFPATTGKQLFALTKAFLEFTKGLKIGGDTAKNLRRTFAGVFAIFDIGWQAVKAIFGVLGDLFGLIGSNTGGFLAFTANIGDFLVKLDEAIKKGDLFNNFFRKLAGFISGPLAAIKAFGQAIVSFFKGFDASPLAAVSGLFGALLDRLRPLAGIAGAVGKAFGGLVQIFGAIASFLQPVIAAIGDAFGSIIDAIAQTFSGGDFSAVFDALNTGLLLGIVLLIKKFLSTGLKLDFGGGFLGGLKDTFETLTGTLTALQTQVKAKTLLLIAAAVALLVASIVALSLIDSGKLTSSMTALGVAFGQLLIAMGILDKITSNTGFLKVPIIAAAMISLSIAVLILTAAVKVLSGLSWEELAKGLLGVAALLAMLVGASKGLEKSSGSLLRAGLALIPMAIGIKILASAVKDFSGMSWGEIAKGLTSLAGSLLIIGTTVNLMPKSMALQAVGLVIFAAGLKILASALGDFGSMDWGTIGKGLVGMAASLIVVAGAVALMPASMIAQGAGLVVFAAGLVILGQAMQSFGQMSWGEIAKGLVTMAGALVLIAAAVLVMPPTMIAQAAGLVVVAVALNILATALQSMGGMSWGEIAKGLVTLAGSLAILAAGLILMTGSLSGSAALLVAAAALAIFVPVLQALGAMSWGDIVKGLATLAAVFLVLGVSAALLAPVVPILLGLGVAMILLGGAFALAGVGALAFATAFAIFAAAGTAGIAVLAGIIALIPALATAVAAGLINFAIVIAAQGAVFVGAFATLLVAMLDAIIQIAPKIGQALNVLVALAVSVLLRNVPKLVQAGLLLIMSILNAVASRIGQIVTIATNLIVNFLNGITRNIPRIVKAGVDLVVKLMEAIASQQARLLSAGAKMIISFINNLASTIRSNAGDLRAAGVNLAAAIIDGMTGGLASAAYRVAQAAASAAKNALAAAKNALGIKSPSKEFYKVGRFSMLGLAKGMDQNRRLAALAAQKAAHEAVEALRKSLSDTNNTLRGGQEFQTTIRPVIDLTEATRGLNRLDKLMADRNRISTNIAFRHATGIDNDIQAVHDRLGVQPVTNVVNKHVEFNQHNTSPIPLPVTTIYRNTRSQISTVKEALDA